MDDANAIVLRLQASGDHSEHEVRAQLERRGFSALEVERAIDWGRQHAALSDARAARETVRKEAGKLRGALRIEAVLERRGLDATVTTSFADECQRAEQALAPRLSKYLGEPVKAAQWLGRQGYDEEVVRRVVEKLVGPLD